MKIYECRTQELLIEALLLRTKLDSVNQVDSSDKDAIIILIKEQEVPIASARLSINETTANLSSLVISDELIYGITCLNMIEQFCLKYSINTLLVETEFEQSTLYKKSDFLIKNDVFIKDNKVYTELYKKFENIEITE